LSKGLSFLPPSVGRGKRGKRPSEGPDFPHKKEKTTT